MHQTGDNPAPKVMLIPAGLHDLRRIYEAVDALRSLSSWLIMRARDVELVAKASAQHRDRFRKGRKHLALYTTIHFHNVPAGREAEYTTWFDGRHRTSVTALRGFKDADRYEVTREQIMADIPQPWRYVSVYDFDLPDPAIDVPALGPLIAEARDAGLIVDDETERLYTYQLYSDWKGSPNWQRSEPFSGVSIILGNYVPGRRAEYHKWYDEVHSVEVTNVPGHVAMKRGELAPLQIEPRRYCPGDQLILCAQQSDDLSFTIKDFSARAGGRSPSGIAMQPRSASGSVARTVHYFRKISGKTFWRGGIAYAGDLSVYPGKGKS